MAENPTIDLATLTADSKCFKCWSDTEKKAATLWLMAKGLKALIPNSPSHDFTNVNDLQKAIACFRCVPQSTLEAYRVVTFKNLALFLGGISDLSASEIRAQAKCWFCLDPKALDAGYEFLLNEIIGDLAGENDDD